MPAPDPRLARIIRDEDPPLVRPGVVAGGRRGDYEAAVSLFREALARHRQRLGDAHPQVTATLYGLAWALSETGDYETGEQLFREVLERYAASGATSTPT